MTINLFTFCVDIDKHTQDELRSVLSLLVSSLDKNVKNYELIVYTNFDLNLEHKLVKIRKYYDNTPIKERKLITSSNEFCKICKLPGELDKCDGKMCDVQFHKNCLKVEDKDIEVAFCPNCFPPKGFFKFKNKWLNLSFNKINLYNDLYNETGINYTWIDLDTYVTSDISYINNIDAFFVENGGLSDEKWFLFMERRDYAVTTNRYIQGNVWKLNRTHYTNIMNLYEELLENKMYPQYDLQDIFNFYVHFKGVDVPILDGLNGLAIWYEKKHEGPNSEALAKFYYDENGILRTSYHPDKEIHFVSFVMHKLLTLMNDENFKNLIK